MFRQFTAEQPICPWSGRGFNQPATIRGLRYNASIATHHQAFYYLSAESTNPERQEATLTSGNTLEKTTARPQPISVCLRKPQLLLAADEGASNEAGNDAATKQEEVRSYIFNAACLLSLIS